MDTKSIVYIALFAALTAALGLFPPITLPVVSVPITAQSMGVMLAGVLAGSKRGGLALALFIALVAVGLPLLAGGRGGLGVIAGPSGGFLLAWPVSAFLIGWLHERAPGANIVMSALFTILGGILFMYAVGVPWMAAAAGLPPLKALTIALAYVPGDLIKVGLTVIIAQGVRRAYPAL